jgi:hypothetical protein
MKTCQFCYQSCGLNATDEVNEDCINSPTSGISITGKKIQLSISTADKLHFHVPGKNSGGGFSGMGFTSSFFKC